METKTVVMSFANQKGGVGKTTLTCITANALAAKGYKILVVDADYQGSMLSLRKTDMSELGEEYAFSYKVIYSDPKDLNKVLDEADGNYDLVMIDMPGQSFGDGLSDLLVSLDYALIPTKTGDTDVSSTMDFLETLSIASEIREKSGWEPIRYSLIINEAETNTTRFKNLIDFIKSEGLCFSEDMIVKKRTAIKDLTNTFQNPLDINGGEDIRTFCKSIEEMIWLKNQDSAR